MINKSDEHGFIQSAVFSIIFVVLFVASSAFGAWAFMGRQDYKNNSDKKSADAVAFAKEEQKNADEAEFAEREKEPNETYDGPAEFGSIKVSYPKTWGLYVETKSGGATPIDGYGHPKFVPGTQSDTAFALRFQVVSADYATLLKQYESATKNGSVEVSPFRAEKVKDVLGSRIDGEISKNRSGSAVMIPLRDKTLKIWTESESYLSDFEKVLKELTFSP